MKQREYPPNWQIPVDVIEYEKTITALRQQLAEKDKELVAALDSINHYNETSNKIITELEQENASIRQQLAEAQELSTSNWGQRERAEKAETELAALQERMKGVKNAAGLITITERGNYAYEDTSLPNIIAALIDFKQAVEEKR